MGNYIADLRRLVGSRPIISVGATILVRSKVGEILLQKRSDTKTWGLPGGGMEPGENLEQTARRELQEETGLIVQDLRLIDVFSGPDYFFVYPNGDQVHTVIVLYEAVKIMGELKPLDDESLALQYFPLNDLPQMESRAKAILNSL